MSFFDDQDPFEDILRDFFGRSASPVSNSEEIISGEDDERIIDFIEIRDKLFLVFELPGYDKQDVLVVVKKNEIEIVAKKQNFENLPDYLSRKLNTGILIKKNLPKSANYKKFNHTFKNGILEVCFEKIK